MCINCFILQTSTGVKYRCKEYFKSWCYIDLASFVVEVMLGSWKKDQRELHAFTTIFHKCLNLFKECHFFVQHASCALSVANSR